MILSKKGRCGNGGINQRMRKFHRLYELRGNIFVRGKIFEKKQRKSDVGQ